MLYGIIFFMLIAVTFEVAGKAMGMARVTLGSVINSISGSIDQMVYSTWKGINYIRSKAKTSDNPQSTDQASIRARTAECSKYWMDTLTVDERAAWEVYAAGLSTAGSAPGDIIHRGKGPWSGFTAFMRNNQLGFTSGALAMGAFVAAAPIGITPPDAPILAMPTWLTPDISVVWAEGTVKGTHARIWIRKSNGKFFHAQLGWVALANALMVAIPTIKGKRGIAVPFTGAPGLYDVQMDIVNATGQVSPPSAVQRYVVVN